MPDLRLLITSCLGEGLAGLVVLDVVVGEEPRESGDVGGDQGAVSVFEKPDDLLLVAFHLHCPLPPTLFFRVLLVYKLVFARRPP